MTEEMTPLEQALVAVRDPARSLESICSHGHGTPETVTGTEMPGGHAKAEAEAMHP